MSDVLPWVLQKITALLGISDQVIAEYLVNLCEKSYTPDDYLNKLNNTGSIEMTPQVNAFAKELFHKVPHKQKKTTASTMVVKNAITLGKNLKEYNILESDDETTEFDEKTSSSRNVNTKKKFIKLAKKRNFRKRKSDSDSDKEIVIKKSKSNKPRKFSDIKQNSSEDEWDKEKKTREKDLKERDEFAERLKKRDKEKTRKLAESKKLKKDDQKELTTNEKREKSRREYLKMREAQKLEELNEKIIDEEIFQDENLTQKEKLRHQNDKEVLKLAKQYKEIHEKDNRSRFFMNDSNKNKVQYLEEPEDLKDGYHTNAEHKRWEDTRLNAAKIKYGAKDKISVSKKYDIIAEDEIISFVQATTIKSTIKEDDIHEIEVSKKEKKIMSIKEVRESLPIFKYRNELVQAVKNHQVVIIEGETGSGKTTQIPQYLYEEGFCENEMKVGCTQPRRVAAMSVATRVAEEMGSKVGHISGYSIRFEDRTSDSTRIKYMTDGMLLREFLTEPDLKGYSVIIIDEAHERTLHTDVLLGLLKDIIKFRIDLKLLISSATLDTEKFSTFFDDAPIFRIPGRRFPVDIFYTKAPEADYIDACVATVFQIHLTQPKGDVLIFLTGQAEIEHCCELLKEKQRGLGSKARELIVLELYANLPTDMQAKIFEPTPHGARKVIVATNIAETSLTIDGIVYVIDPGFCKQNSYNARTGMESLVEVPCSQQSANQRSGRAGRVGPGKCFRLYTAWAFQNELSKSTIPEIQRTNLANVVLLLKSLGINDLIHFDYMDPPPFETLKIALEQLYALGALNCKGELTKMGRRMAEFPANPMLSKTILASELYKCSEEVLTIVSMLSVNSNIFYSPKDKKKLAETAHKNFSYGVKVGDHMTLLNVYNQWAERDYSTQWCAENFIQHRSMKRARDIRDQLANLMERVEIEPTSNISDDVGIRKAFTSGFFYNAAQISKAGGYRTVKQKQTVYIHPGSCLFDQEPKTVVYHEVVFTKKEFMRQLIEIDSTWLVEVAPHYYKASELPQTNKKMPKVVGKTAKDLEGTTHKKLIPTKL